MAAIARHWYVSVHTLPRCEMLITRFVLFRSVPDVCAEVCDNLVARLEGTIVTNVAPACVRFDIPTDNECTSPLTSSKRVLMIRG